MTRCGELNVGPCPNSPFWIDTGSFKRHFCALPEPIRPLCVPVRWNLWFVTPFRKLDTLTSIRCLQWPGPTCCFDSSAKCGYMGLRVRMVVSASFACSIIYILLPVRRIAVVPVPQSPKHCMQTLLPRDLTPSWPLIMRQYVGAIESLSSEFFELTAFKWRFNCVSVYFTKRLS